MNLLRTNVLLAIVLYSCGSVVCAQTDFFWSTQYLNSGAVNAKSVEVFVPPGETGELFLYFTTNGPAMSNIKTGIQFDISTSNPGAIYFTESEALNFDLLFGPDQVDIDLHRWYGFGGGDVLNHRINRWIAFAFFDGNGIDEEVAEEFMLTDAGYDAAADAYLVGRIEFTVVTSATTRVRVLPEDFLVIDALPGFCGASPVQAVFGEAVINPGAEWLVGDVDRNGIVELADIPAFVGSIGGAQYRIEADINGDGAIGLQDMPLFVELLAGIGNEQTSGGTGEPGKCLLGDVNQDGELNLLDFYAFSDLLVSGEYLCEADVNEDGVVDIADIPCFWAPLIGN